MNASDSPDPGPSTNQEPPRARHPLSCGCKTAIVMVGVPLVVVGFNLLFILTGIHENYPVKVAAMSNAKQLALDALMYANDSDDRLPPANSWMDQLVPYALDSGPFHSPAVRHSYPYEAKQDDLVGQLYGTHLGDEVVPSQAALDRSLNRARESDRFGFAYRRQFSMRTVASIRKPGFAALVYDSSDTRWNANGGLDLLPNPGRYDNRDLTRVNAVAFVDGHVKLLRFGDPSIK